ncbi:hypothetical protein HNP40_004094 [Mycobacteroides chelonae]|nr:hypothetical protein [Mycobacteroides chelonae]
MGDAVDYHTNDVQHHSSALPHLDDSSNPTDVTYRFVRMQYPGE